MTSSIDQAEWHYAGDFPRELPREAGGTHIGMYLAWVLQRDLGSATLRKYARDSLPLLRQRKITGRELLFTELNEKFYETLLTKVGRELPGTITRPAAISTITKRSWAGPWRPSIA